MSSMGRKKNNDYPPYMTADGDRGGFVVRNPETGQKKRYPLEKEAEARETAKLVAEWIEKRRQRAALELGRPIVATLISRWRDERLPLMPWDDSTRQTAEDRLNRIDGELGTEFVEALDCLALGKWLSKTAHRADPFNKWRYILVLLWRFAVSQKLALSNEAEKVERRSTSRKIKSNRKTRQQLDVSGFRAVHKAAPEWLKLAMELSLVTLQARKEVCSIKHTDFRNGFLFVIRDKVAGESDMAFIKIKLTAELEAIRSRAIQLDSIASPYLIHRAPERRQRRWMANKVHWTCVNGDYLSKAFGAARDTVERFSALPERERPTFHEIRGLGSRLYLAKGIPKSAIQALMTHSSAKTTEIYLEHGPQALTDDDFHTVSAPFTLGELIGNSGLS